MVKRQQAQMVAEPKTKIEYAAQLYQQGYKVPQIAEALEISPRTVRGYIYRTAHPDKFKEIVARYFAKKRASAEAQAPKEEPKQKAAKIPQAPAAKAIPKWKAPAKQAKEPKITKEIAGVADAAIKKARKISAEIAAEQAQAAKPAPKKWQKK
jgi:hypothetical protein